MLIIKCVRCRRKVFRYLKLGKGRVLHCWKNRIIKDYSIREGKKVLCRCEHLIGTDEEKWIKMHQGSFYHTGTKSNKK